MDEVNLSNDFFIGALNRAFSYGYDFLTYLMSLDSFEKKLVLEPLVQSCKRATQR